MRRMTEQEFRAYSLSGNLYRLIIQVGTPLAVFALFNLLLQESPSSKRSERWRGMEEETSGMIRLQYEEMVG